MPEVDRTIFQNDEFRVTKMLDADREYEFEAAAPPDVYGVRGWQQTQQRYGPASAMAREIRRLLKETENIGFGPTVVLESGLAVRQVGELALAVCAAFAGRGIS